MQGHSKSVYLYLPGIIFFATSLNFAHAGSGEQTVPLTPASHWSLGAGLSVRSMDASFKMTPGSVPMEMSQYNSSRSVTGKNVGFFTGGATPVVYDDGQVGPVGSNQSALWARGIINSHSQVVDSGRTTTTGGSDGRIYDVNFHTTAEETTTSFKSQYEASSNSFSDSETGGSPYLVLRYRGPQLLGIDFGLITGYSWFGKELNSGDGVLSTYSVIKTLSKIQRTSTYSYDGLQIPNGPLTTGTEPITVNTLLTALTYNSSGQPNGWNLQDPRLATNETIDQSDLKIEDLQSIGRANVDINLHEIPFGIELGRMLGSVGVSFATGPTLNIINYELTSTRFWQDTDNGARFQEELAKDSDTPVKLGCFGAVNIQVPLVASGAINLEAGASYRWIDSFKISDGITATELDLSSWEGHIGISVPFNL